MATSRRKAGRDGTRVPEENEMNQQTNAAASRPVRPVRPELAADARPPRRRQPARANARPRRERPTTPREVIAAVNERITTAEAEFHALQALIGADGLVECRTQNCGAKVSPEKARHEWPMQRSDGNWTVRVRCPRHAHNLRKHLALAETIHRGEVYLATERAQLRECQRLSQLPTASRGREVMALSTAVESLREAARTASNAQRTMRDALVDAENRARKAKSAVDRAYSALTGATDETRAQLETDRDAANSALVIAEGNVQTTRTAADEAYRTADQAWAKARPYLERLSAIPRRNAADNANDHYGITGFVPSAVGAVAYVSPDNAEADAAA